LNFFTKIKKNLEYQKTYLHLHRHSEKESGNPEAEPARDKGDQRRMGQSEMVAFFHFNWSKHSLLLYL